MSEPNESESVSLNFAMFSVILFTLLGAVFGAIAAINVVHTTAANAGAARYTVNPKTGETRFEWVNPEVKP